MADLPNRAWAAAALFASFSYCDRLSATSRNRASVSLSLPLASTTDTPMSAKACACFLLPAAASEMFLLNLARVAVRPSTAIPSCSAAYCRAVKLSTLRPTARAMSLALSAMSMLC
ncbi:hypothetical protein D9M68_981080 [compost metagenome]